MAAKANQQTEAEMQPQDSAAEAQDNDAAQQTLKTLMRLGKERGYVTHDELNAALPAEDFTSEQIDDFMSTLNEMGVSVVEAADSDDSSEGEGEEQRSTGNVSDSDVSGTDDPVRMYLREMGSVELLSREGEIAIAKRIEAGRELMIGGICESPLTIRALLHWRDQIADGVVPLRDIIDLETTYAKLNGAPVDGDMMSRMDDDIDEDDLPEEEAEEEEAEEESEEDGDADTDTSTRDANTGDEGDDLNMSLAAMEDAIRDHMMDVFDQIATLFKQFSRSQDRRLAKMANDEPLSPRTEATHLDLEVSNHSSYRPYDPSLNVLSSNGKFAQINLECGFSVDLRAYLRLSCASAPSCRACEDSALTPDSRIACYAAGCACVTSTVDTPADCQQSHIDANIAAYSCTQSGTAVTLPAGVFASLTVFDIDVSVRASK